jgi:hypothetical protein
VQANKDLAWGEEVLADVYMMTGHPAEALSHLAHVRTLPGGDTAFPLAQEGYAYAVTNGPAEARRKLAEMEAAGAKTGIWTPTFLLKSTWD